MTTGYGTPGMEIGDGRVPAAPGSHPSGHAASGVDGASRVDPSRDAMRAAVIMVRMGFPESENGRFVTQLRAHILSQCEQGLVNRSGGTWGPAAEGMSYEDRAKAILAIDWELDHGHSYRVEHLDGDLRTFRELRAWVGDRFRLTACRARMFWSRKVLQRCNPYRDSDRSAEGGETRSGSTVGESAGRDSGIAQTSEVNND